MATPTEETKKFIITREDREAAETLIALRRDIRYQVDNSMETLMIIQAWNRSEPNPRENIPNGDVDLVEPFSKPIKKQLTVSDVKKDLCRLMLGKDQVKNKTSPLLNASEIQRLTEGLNVSVYGRSEKGMLVQNNMTFKMWCKGTPVLTSGWKTFAETCDLKEHCDFLHIWMFRKRDTREICFVIQKATHSTITKPLGKEILDQIN
ncbi:unnamed protein product [Eruca vesicaria subsp. sativa]|uniref:TF-B3 domain-containing protein n=1 Tax=Eruca vesicaria subsp. sativa TaxID=29727 RepID=A0ABC8LM72_ERUVS|nr:unnamed protein product [Eruca vesicaria subsp. sativa]